jgi:hypothetical protein
VQLDRGVLVEELVQTLGPERERPDHLGPVEALLHAVDHARLDEVDHAVGHEFGVDAEVLVVRQRRHDRVGDCTDAGLDRRAVRDPFGHEGGDLEIGLTADRGLDLDQLAVAATPAHDLGDVDLVAAERTRHVVGHFEEDAAPPDEARGVVGRDAEGEVAVPIGW